MAEFNESGSLSSVSSNSYYSALEDTTEHSGVLKLSDGKTYGAVTTQPTNTQSLFFESLLAAKLIPAKAKVDPFPVTVCSTVSGCFGYSTGFFATLFVYSSSSKATSLLVATAAGANTAICAAVSCGWLVMGYHYADQYLQDFLSESAPSPPHSWKRYTAITSKIIAQLDKQDRKDRDNGIPDALLDSIKYSHSLRDPVCFKEDPLQVYSARVIMQCIKHGMNNKGEISLTTGQSINIKELYKNRNNIRPYSTEPQQIKVMLLKKAFVEFDQSVDCKNANKETEAKRHQGNLTKIITEIDSIEATSTWEEWLKTHTEYTRPEDY